MSVVHYGFTPQGQPIEEEKEEETSPLKDALGNAIEAIGQGVMMRSMMGGGGKLGRNQKPKMGTVSKKVPKTTSSPYTALKTKMNDTLPPYSKTAPKVPFGKAPAKPPSLLNRAKSAVSRTVRKALPKPTPKKSTRKPPPIPYKVATQKMAPPKPPRKRAGDPNSALKAFKTSLSVQKSERAGAPKKTGFLKSLKTSYQTAKKEGAQRRLAKNFETFNAFKI